MINKLTHCPKLYNTKYYDCVGLAQSVACPPLAR